jgi:superfamily II DNA or RNA helicase
MNPIIINNIAGCKKRNDFIISLLPPLIEESRTILILTERIAQVTYIHDIIEESGLTSIGKYIGRLKQDVLDASLQCRIIIGTYNMIEEGFDCKSLDTLIMATPKVNIEQSVGRILRKQKADRTIKPLVIDIYDQFANNINKGKRRLAFYRKQKYDIKNIIVDDNQSPPLIINMKCDSKKESKKETNVIYKF